MSARENTLQLPPQFHSISASESESETKINLIKIRKYIMYNNKYLNRLYESYYDSVFAFLSLKT